MAERTRFAARASNAFPIIGIGLIAAITLPLLGGGWWFLGGPALGGAAIYVALTMPKGTIVIVDKQGLLDRRLGIGSVAWRYISAVDRVEVMGIVYINVDLTVAGEAVVVFPWFRRLTNPLRKMMGVFPVHVNASGLDGTPDELFSSIKLALATGGGPDGPPRKTPTSSGRAPA